MRSYILPLGITLLSNEFPHVKDAVKSYFGPFQTWKSPDHLECLQSPCPLRIHIWVPPQHSKNTPLPALRLLSAIPTPGYQIPAPQASFPSLGAATTCDHSCELWAESALTSHMSANTIWGVSFMFSCSSLSQLFSEDFYVTAIAAQYRPKAMYFHLGKNICVS